MADVPVLAPAEGPVPPGGSASGKRRGALWLVIGLGVVLLAGGIGAAVLTHAFDRLAAGEAHAAAHPKPAGPPLYLAFDPPFVVNFQADQIVRFLQLSVEVMSHDPQTLELLKSNDPVVRNDLLLLFSDQKYSVLATPQGKEQLRAQALAAVRKDIAQAGGNPDQVEAIYFTSFVMQ